MRELAPVSAPDSCAITRSTGPPGANCTTTNDTNSYLASTIGQQAAETIKAAIVQEVNREAASRFLLALSDIRSDLSTAADAAAQLSDGAQAAHTGAATLADGTSQLASGSATLRDGLGTLASQTANLPSQTAQLADGAQQVAAGDTTLAGYAGQAGALSQQAAANAIASTAEGYSFPTNLDRDPPIGGLAPETQQALFHRAPDAKWTPAQFAKALADQAAKKLT